jgi:hypothetical protein
MDWPQSRSLLILCILSIHVFLLLLFHRGWFAFQEGLVPVVEAEVVRAVGVLRVAMFAEGENDDFFGAL